MADKATFDPISKLIILKPGVVAVDVGIDLYSDAKEEWLADSGLHKYKFPFRVVGGDTTEGEQAIPGYFYLRYGWRVRPQEANHLLVLSGILLVEGSGDPFVNTLGDYNVRVKYVLPLQAITVTAGSGVTEQDKLDIANMVDSSPVLAGVKNAVLGRWKMDGAQMIFYAEDNETEVARFNLFNKTGSPATKPAEVFERVRV